MARPIIKYAEFFPHYSRDRHDLRIKALEKRMRHTGYAIHFRLMEFLTGCDSSQIDYTLPHVRDSLPDELMCTEDEFSIYLSHALELGLIIEENGTLYSPDLLERLQPLERTRELDRRRKSRRNNPLSDSFPGGKPPENTRKTPSKAEQSKAEQSKAEKSKVNKQNTLRSRFVEEENGKTTADLLKLPFASTFDCLCYILAEYDRAKGEKAKQARRRKAESLIQKYSEDHVKDKLFHFLWIARYKPALLGDKPTSYLIESIEKPYPPPAGYEEWQEKTLTAKRKSEKSTVKPWEKKL